MAHQSSAAKAPILKLSSWQRFASIFREAHPIGRAPKYLKAYDAPGAAFHFRRFARTGVVFVPFMVGFCKSFSPSSRSQRQTDECMELENEANDNLSSQSAGPSS
jgi:hypothetical protein